MLSPASNGPMNCDACPMLEFNDTAFIRCVFGTSRGIMAIRAGPIVMFTADVSAVAARMCHTRTAPTSVSTPSAAARTRFDTSPSTMSFLRSSRSASAPPNSPSANSGTACANPVNPSWNADPDMSYTW